MSRQWIYLCGDDVVGPFTSIQLKEHAASGRLRPDMKVALQEGSDWIQAKSVKGLFSKEQLESFSAEEELDRFLAEKQQAELQTVVSTPRALPSHANSDQQPNTVALQNASEVSSSATSHVPIVRVASKSATSSSASNLFIILGFAVSLTVVVFALAEMAGLTGPTIQQKAKSPDGIIEALSVFFTNSKAGAKFFCCEWVASELQANEEHTYIVIDDNISTDLNAFGMSRSTSERQSLRRKLSQVLNLQIRETGIVNKPYIATVEIPVLIACRAIGPDYNVLLVIEFELDPEERKTWWKGSSVVCTRRPVGSSHPGEALEESLFPLKVRYSDWTYACQGWRLLFQAAYKTTRK